MEVSFTKAKYSSRLFAFLADLLMMVIAALFMVLGAFEIMKHVPYYRNAGAYIKNVQLISHLYYQEDNGDMTILCDHYSPTSEEECQTYNVELDNALRAFYLDEAFFNQDDPESGYSLYIKQRLDSQYFIYEDDTHTDVVPKEGVTQKTLYKCYSLLMKEDAMTYMMRYPGYVESVKTINLSFIFIILLLPITISVTTFEFVIPLCLRRGRKTLGKLFFKLAVVDARGLSPSFWRFFARFSLFLFVEVLLSSVTFFVPMIVSFSMFFFSKANQSFHDYITGTYVVDSSTSRIFLNEKEYIQVHEESEKFVLHSEDVHLH